ncbi:hypothetical protein [Aeromicrobium sp. P5_D10]
MTATMGLARQIESCDRTNFVNKIDRYVLTIFMLIVVPVPVNILTESLRPEYRWITFVAVSSVVMSVLLTWPGGFLSRDRHGRSRFGKYLSFAMFIAYLLIGVRIGVSEQGAGVSHLCLVLLWASVAVLVVNSLEETRRFGEVAVGLAALLIGAGYLIDLARCISDAPQETPFLLVALPVLFLAIAWLMYAGAFVKGYFSLIGLGLIAMGLCDLTVQARAFSDGDELLALARLIKGVSFVLAGYAWLGWSKRAGAGALLLFGAGWALESAEKVMDGHTVAAAGDASLALTFWLLAILVARPESLGGPSRRWVWLRITAFFGALCPTLWGVADLLTGYSLLGISYLLLGVGMMVMLINFDIKMLSASRMFTFWFSTGDKRPEQ